MKVSELLKLGYINLTSFGDLDRPVCGVYICDLLSWTMAHAQKDNAWVTVQVHSNIVAVALLTEVSCIIVPEGIAVNEDTISKANEEKIPILSTNKTAYQVAIDIYHLGEK